MASLAASPGSVANGAGPSGPNWINPGNAASDNDSYATASMILESTTQYLVATNFDFSAVPVGATINGLLCSVRAFAPDPAHLDEGAFYNPTAADWFISETDFPTANLSPTEEKVDCGGSTDLCGTTWERSDILDSAFGVRFIAASSGSEIVIVSVDWVQVVVYYTPLGGTAIENKIVSVAQAIHRASSY